MFKLTRSEVEVGVIWDEMRKKYLGEEELNLWYMAYLLSRRKVEVFPTLATVKSITKNRLAFTGNIKGKWEAGRKV